MSRSKRTRTGFPWTAAELLTLQREWHQLSQRRLGERLKRTWCAIWQRANQEGLPMGIPQGSLSLKATAAKLGITQSTLRAVLAAASIEPRRTYSGTHRGTLGVYVRRYVEWDDALEAFEGWLETESARSAALRRGLDPSQLRRWLIAAGAITPGHVRGVAQRVPTEVIDRVVAERRPAPTARAA